MREAATHHDQAIGELHDRDDVHFLVIVALDISLTPEYWQSAHRQQASGRVQRDPDRRLDIIPYSPY